MKRRLDFWTSVSRVDFIYRWGRLSVTPHCKFMLVRLRDQECGVNILSEIRSIPILRVAYPVFRRTSLQGGIQGIGRLPYRLHDDTASRNSFKRRTTFVTVTNRTDYFGYELVTILGVHEDQRIYDTKFKDVRNFRPPHLVRARPRRLHRVRPAHLSDNKHAQSVFRATRRSRAGDAVIHPMSALVILFSLTSNRS